MAAEECLANQQRSQQEVQELNTSATTIETVSTPTVCKMRLDFSDETCYLTGKCSCILAMRPIEGSERVYIVARIAMTTKSQEEGLAG